MTGLNKEFPPSSVMNIKALRRVINQTFVSPEFDNGIKGCSAPFKTEWFNTHPHAKVDVTYKFNDWGFRSNFDYTPLLGQKIVACYGVSISMGLSVPYEVSLGNIMQDYFNVPVLNFGVRSASLDTLVDISREINLKFDVEANIFLTLFTNKKRLNSHLSYYTLSGKEEEEFVKNQFLFMSSLNNFIWAYEIPKFRMFKNHYNIDLLKDAEKTYNKHLVKYPEYLDYSNKKLIQEFVNKDRKQRINKFSYLGYMAESWPTYVEFIDYKKDLNFDELTVEELQDIVEFADNTVISRDYRHAYGTYQHKFCQALKNKYLDLKDKNEN